MANYIWLWRDDLVNYHLQYRIWCEFRHAKAAKGCFMQVYFFLFCFSLFFKIRFGQQTPNRIFLLISEPQISIIFLFFFFLLIFFSQNFWERRHSDSGLKSNNLASRPMRCVNYFIFFNHLFDDLIKETWDLGSKKDIWISINPETGERVYTFEASTSPTEYCPANHPQAVHIGKTEYQIQMLDTKHRDRQWNATFVDYSSHLLPGEKL